MPQPLNAVIAGSKSFVEAVQPQLQLRLGAAPEVATDPAAALQACARRGGLLVFEHGAPEWAEALRSLRGRQGPVAVAVIAAVADLASAAQPIDGVDEVVPWQGRPDPVMWAVERVVARARAAAPPPLPRAPVAQSASVPARALDIYELGGTDAVAEPAAGDPTPADPTAWPNAVPTPGEAELLLARAVAGELPPGDAGVRVAGVVAALSRIERSALAGALDDVEHAVLVAAAALRLRVAEALATAPATEVAIDRFAAERLLGDVDAVLGRVKAHSGSATPDVAAELGVVRGALVSAGVALSAVISGFGGAREVPAASSPSPKPDARVLSNTGEDVDDHAPRSRRGLLVAFLVVLALTVAYHVAQARGPAPRALPTIAGAPSTVVVLRRSAGWLVTALPGKQVDRGEMDAFVAREQAKGNTVKQIGAGMWMIDPPSRKP
jgi:hypothetical protein